MIQTREFMDALVVKWIEPVFCSQIVVLYSGTFDGASRPQTCPRWSTHRTLALEGKEEIG